MGSGMDDSDVEFQDEWEEVQQPIAAAAAADQLNGDITINLSGKAQHTPHALMLAGCAVHVWLAFEHLKRHLHVVICK
jgi:hypothetical protein